MPRLAREPVFDFPNVGTKFAFLQDDRILYAGQPIAMVVAETREQAAAAAERVRIDYAPEIPVATLAEGEAGARKLEMLYGVCRLHTHAATSRRACGRRMCRCVRPTRSRRIATIRSSFRRRRPSGTDHR
jgi:hypothetical protein